MRQLLTVIFILVITTALFSQDNDLKSKELDDQYSWRNTTQSALDSFYLGLPVVELSPFKTHIRISIIGQTIDLFSSDNDSFHGRLTNEIIEYKNVKEEWGEGSHPFQIVYQTQNLDTTISKHLATYILQSGQEIIPTDSLIPGWNDYFLHCGSVGFQFKIDDKYSEQTYFCPWSQNDTVDFKDVVISNYEYIKDKLDLIVRYDGFTGILPKGKTYSKDGYRMIYTMTDEQSQAWAKDKPRRDYLKSVKDTIDNYLRAELLKQKMDLNNLNCFKDFRLTFGKNGRLDKIVISDYNKPKLKDGLSFYMEDRREIRRCNRKIKEIFKKIDLSFFDLKHEFHRTLSFGLAKEIQLRDDTVY